MDGVASRFACLQDDDSTDWVKPKDKSKKNKNNTVNTEGKPGTGKNKKKNKANIEAKELQQLAFQTSSKKAKNKSKSKEGTPKPSSKEEAQYEEWREKDEKFTSDAYVEDIEKAILLSKIDHEEHMATIKILDEERAKLALLELSKKPKTMSLDQFHKLEGKEINDTSLESPIIHQDVRINTKGNHAAGDKAFDSTPNLKPIINGRIPNVIKANNSEEFFKKVEQDAQTAINKEHFLHSSRNMSVTKNGMALNESALMEQFKATVALKDIEISKLQNENETSLTELTKIKKRYKAMRSILDQAELKEKAEILIEVEKLRKVRDEMSENITQLTGELEQSKTREHLLGKELRTLQERYSSKNSQGGSHSTSDKS